MAYTQLGTRGCQLAPNIGVEYEVSVNNSYSNTQSCITINFRTYGSGKVWNHGILVQATCNGSTLPSSTLLSTKNALIGCIHGYVPESQYQKATKPYTKTLYFYVDKTNSAQTISWSVLAHAAEYVSGTSVDGLKDQRKINSASGTVTVDAKPTYTVTFDLKNGVRTGGGDLTQTIYHGDSATAPKVTRTDYAWGGWDKTFSNITANTTVNAIWTPVYTNPGAPSNVYIDTTLLSRKKLTVKENWTWKWTAGTAGNSHTPVKGYGMRLYKNGEPVDILNPTTGVDISNDGVARNWYYRETTECSLIINPLKQGFKAGDKIKLGIYSFSRNGDNAIIWNGNGYADAEVFSPEYIIQNAGVAKIKTSDSAGSWEEGQVWIKVDKNGVSTWVEAETVSIKTADGWKESE
jgi:hypothetical protein